MLICNINKLYVNINLLYIHTCMLSFIVHIISTHVSLIYLTGYRNVGLIEDMSVSRDVGPL